MFVKSLAHRLLPLSFILFFGYQFSVAQNIYEIESPYELTLRRDLPLFLVGAVGQITATIQQSKIDVYTEEEINGLNADNVNSFDRRATTYHSETALLATQIVSTTAYALPLAFAIDRRTRNGFLQVSFMAVESYLLNGAVTNLTRANSKRTSPFAYNPDFDMSDRLVEEARTSFFSWHTSHVATLSFFSAKVFSDYHTNSKWKPLVWSSAIALPAAVGYLRVRAGQDFPTDVITGYAVGGLIGILVPQLHKKKNKDQPIGLTPYGSGDTVGLLMTW